MEKRIYRTRIRGGFMKMRLTLPVAAPGAWLVAGRSAAGAVLLAVTVSACTGGGLVGAVDLHAHALDERAVRAPAGTRTPSPAGGASQVGRRVGQRHLDRAGAALRLGLAARASRRRPHSAHGVRSAHAPSRDARVRDARGRPAHASPPDALRARRRTRRPRRSPRPRRRPAAAARRACRTACCSASAARRSWPASAPSPTAGASPASSASARQPTATRPARTASPAGPRARPQRAVARRSRIVRRPGPA